MLVFIDMDDVLCDFIGGVCQLFNLERDTLYRNWEPEEWLVGPAISRVLGVGIPMPNDVFQYLVLERSDLMFWTYLQPLSWMREVIEEVEKVTDEWYILSSPMDSPACREGKVIWLKKMFGKDFDRYLLTPHKHTVSGYNRILIDDHPENCKRFEEHGGKSIWFPSLRHDVFGPVDRVDLVRQSLSQLS